MSEQAEPSRQRSSFWLLVMLLPIGLFVGVVTSTCSHLHQDAAKKEAEKFQASVNLSKPDIADDLQKAFAYDPRDVGKRLRFIASSIDQRNFHFQYIKGTEGQENARQGYFEIKGKRENEYTVVLIPMLESTGIPRAARESVAIAVVKSLAGEKKFTHSLRFIFYPRKLLADQAVEAQLSLDVNGTPRVREVLYLSTEELAGEQVAGGWLRNGHAWSHEALVLEEGEEGISMHRIDTCYQAAASLRSYLLGKMLQ